MKNIYFILVIFVLSACFRSNETETYTIKGTFYSDCDLQNPIANEEFSVTFSTRQSFNTGFIGHTYPFTTDSLGRFEVSYEFGKTWSTLNHGATKAGNIDIADYLANVPSGEDLDLGDVVLGHGYSYYIELEVQNAYSDQDTLIVQDELASGFRIPGPFKDTILGPYEKNVGKTMHLMINDDRVIGRNKQIDLKLNSSVDARFQDTKFINTCEKGHNFLFVIK